MQPVELPVYKGRLCSPFDTGRWAAIPRSHGVDVRSKKRQAVELCTQHFFFYLEVLTHISSIFYPFAVSPG